jgi:hypothetical protein
MDPRTKDVSTHRLDTFDVCLVAASPDGSMLLYSSHPQSEVSNDPDFSDPELRKVALIACETGDVVSMDPVFPDPVLQWSLLNLVTGSSTTLHIVTGYGMFSKVEQSPWALFMSGSFPRGAKMIVVNLATGQQKGLYRRCF